MKALLFGIGASILGMILYAVFAITTGIIIGFVSLAVGWLVGTAMLKGSGGIGGRRYQITAALLTYFAVAMAAVPIWIHYARQEREKEPQKLVAQERQLEKQAEQPSQTTAPAPQRSEISPAEALTKLALLGIASPFVELWDGGPSVSWAIGLFILFIGLKIAWRMTAGRPLQIFGPFENSSTRTP